MFRLCFENHNVNTINLVLSAKCYLNAYTLELKKLYKNSQIFIDFYLNRIFLNIQARLKKIVLRSMCH
jgi:hypothetical protein